MSEETVVNEPHINENEGGETTKDIVTFESLGLSEPLLRAANELGFTTPTPVQQRSIPQLLKSSEDLVSLAQTGTGKTAAFGFPILERLYREGVDHTPKALILSPTRELCKQIAEDLGRYSQFMPQVRIACVYGGSGIRQQIKDLEGGVDIIVATPGRIIDLHERKKAKFNDIQILVLDEADQMLDMGFKEDMDHIVESLPSERQTLLFSATMPAEVEEIARNYTRNYTSIVIGERNSGAQNVKHFYVVIKEEDRYLALKRVVDFFPEIYGIIFCRTKLETQEIAGRLMADGYDVDSIHGDLTQDVREQVMKRFKDKTLSLLVATDVAARGIDVNNLTHVINYKLPDELEIYTHRSGRTGRADKEGQSIVIVNSRELYRLRKIEKMLGKEIRRAKIPGGPEICTKQIEYLIDKLDEVTLPVEAFPFLPILEEKWKTLTRDQIIKKFLAVTANRFLEYYKNAPDLNYIGAAGNTGRDGGKKERRDTGRGEKRVRRDDGKNERRGKAGVEKNGNMNRSRKRGESISEKQDKKWYQQFVSNIREDGDKSWKQEKREKKRKRS